MTRSAAGDVGTRPILRPTTLVPLWLVGLISVWVAYRLLLWPGIAAGFGESALALDALAKLVVWNVPVLLVLRAAGVGAAGRYLFLPGRWRAGLMWGIVAALLLSAHWIVTAATGTTSNTPIDVGTLIVDTLVAPLSEEIAFRGLLFGALADLWHSRVGAAAASSVAFAAIHLPLRISALGWGLPLAADFALTTVYGLLFCFLLAASRSLLAPILAHISYNVVALTG